MPEQPETKEESFEDWLKRLDSEPLKLIEEPEKKEQYSDKMWSDNMAEEMEKDCIKDERGLLQKNLGQLTKDFRLRGLANHEGMTALEKRFKENESEGGFYKDIEESYDKFKKEVKRYGSKYGK